MSDQGRVRSLDRLVGGPHGPRSRVFPGRVLVQYTDKPPRDYPAVMLSKDNRVRRHLIHRLVLEAFEGPCPPGMEARHGPAGKSDASRGNLCWGSRAENTGPDRVRDGQSNRGERHGLSTLTWNQVSEMRERAADGESFSSLSRAYGVCVQTVSNIIHHRTWRYPPSEW